MRIMKKLSLIVFAAAAALSLMQCGGAQELLGHIEDRVAAAQESQNTPGSPLQPTELTADAQDADAIMLTWNDKSYDEEYFELQRKKGLNGTFVTIASPPAGSTSYSDADLDSETEYYYRIRAVNTAGESGWDSAHTLTLELTPPDWSTFEVIDLHMTVYWSNNSAYAESFDIRTKEYDEATYSTLFEDIPANDDNFECEGTKATTYVFQIRSKDAGGESQWSDELALVTNYGIGDYGPAGGIIFYDDVDDGYDDLFGKRYLEVIEYGSGLWENIEWGAYNINISGADYSGLGYGETNTSAIVSALDSLGESGKAAQLCDSLIITKDGVEYKDWFLPSEEEMTVMFNAVGDMLSYYTWEHWSSTQYNHTKAATVSRTGAQSTKEKNETSSVRAVRSF